MSNRAPERFRYNEFNTAVNYNTATGLVTDFIAKTDSWVNVANSTQVGSNDPNWRKKVAKKEDATGNYVRTIWTGHENFARCVSVSPQAGGGVIRSTNVCKTLANAINTFNSGDDLALKDIALGRLKKKLQGIVGDYNIAQPAYELKELRKTIAGGAELLGSTLQTLIDIKRTRGLSAVKYASKAWLTFNFGIKPILGDIADINSSISSWLTRTDVATRISGSAGKAWKTNSHSYNEIGAYNTIRAHHCAVVHKLTYLYTGAFDLRLKSGNNYGVDDHFGLELKSLPALAWELTPYSWAIDYFTTMGAYLSDTFVLPPGSLRYLVLCKRYTAQCDVNCDWVTVPGANSFIEFQRSTPGFLNVVEFSRTKQTSTLPHQALRFKTFREITGSDPNSILGINAEGTMNKLLNLASVLVGSTVGYKPPLPPKWRP